VHPPGCAAPKRPFSRNRFHYNWNWDYGNGDMRNQGVHEMHMARWLLGVNKKRILQFEVRHWISNREDHLWIQPDPKAPTAGYLISADNTIGNLVYGSKGYMAKTVNRRQISMGQKREPGPSGDGIDDHYRNFIEAIRSGDPRSFNKSIEEGFYSCALIRLGNISYRLGCSLDFDPVKRRFIGDDETNAMLTREYRAPFVLPEEV
jgi:predicted dehydrogenase